MVGQYRLYHRGPEDSPLPLGTYKVVILAKACVASRTKHPIIQCVFSALVRAHTSLNRVRVELEKPWGESP